MSDPSLSWLRKIAIALARDDRLEEALSASEITTLCQATGIAVPNTGTIINHEQLTLFVGRLLGHLFRKTDSRHVDQFVVRRLSNQAKRQTSDQTFTQHFYRFEHQNVET